MSTGTLHLLQKLKGRMEKSRLYFGSEEFFNKLEGEEISISQISDLLAGKAYRIKYHDQIPTAEFPSNWFDEVKVLGFSPSDDFLAQVLRILKNSGKLSVEGCFADREAGQRFSQDLKILGFTGMMAAKDPSSGERFVVCEKPEWNIGQGEKISLKPSSNISTGSKWKMSLNDLADEGLVDEDDLLNDGLEKRTTTGCSGEEITLPSGRKACKNCTCGLADEENLSESSDEKKSSCGNCYKGDAYRCANCPYLGLPAFEPGMESVMLSLKNDDI